MQKEVKDKVDKLVNELEQLFGEKLISVAVYGSSLFQEQMPESPGRVGSWVPDAHLLRQCAARLRHLFLYKIRAALSLNLHPHEPNCQHALKKPKNINVMVILGSITLSDLEKASSVGKWWDKAGHSLPMFMSEEEWLRSADIFALEYADIRDNHYLAYGKDLFSDIKVDREALRLVCELELHRKLIFMRQRLIIHKDKPKILLDLLEESVTSFAAIFRGLLRLKLEPDNIPQDPVKLFEAMKDLIQDYDAAPFLKVISSTEGKVQLRQANITHLYNEFISQVSIVTSYADQCLEVV